MKSSRFASILIFALFYTTLLATMVVTPLVLASRYTAGMATVHPDAPMWERSLDAPSQVGRHRKQRLPQRDESVSGQAAIQGPVFNSGPDAAMIKPRKARSKTIKV